MASKKEKFSINSTVTFAVPILNLSIDKSIQGEFKLSQVTFISKDKFIRARKRFSIEKPISELKENPFYKNFFDWDFDTLAVVRKRWDGKFSVNEFQSECLKIVEVELHILLSSLLGYGMRNHAWNIGIQGETKASHQLASFFSKDIGPRGASFSHSREVIPFPLDSSWKIAQKDLFFDQLIEILNRDVKEHRGWRNELGRVAELIGRSALTQHRPTAFLYNMIALETLLTEQSDKYLDAMPLRIEAFLGWLRGWDDKLYKQRIKHIYSLRCAFVHQGMMDKISADDLIFTDELLLNSLRNIVHHPKIFNSKKDIVNFSEKIKAQKILNLKTDIRPKTFKYIGPLYSRKSKNEI